MKLHKPQAKDSGQRFAAELVKCTRCRSRLPLAEFPSAGHGYRRSWCKTCDHKRVADLRARGLSKPKPVEKRPIPKQPIKQKAPKSKKYVITYAQNATPVHAEFLRALEAYCKHNNAVLLVIPGRYKNPTSVWSKRMQSDEWWDDALHPYLFNGRMMLGEHVGVFGDISIQPTAVRPLTGFEVFVGKYSGVFGHPRLQLKTVPTAHRKYPRILTTTGACTIATNYTKSKAGKKGAAHHVLGAAVVEEADGKFHLRQLNALDDGSFIDIDTEYTPGIDPTTGEDTVSITPAAPAEALVCGDIHDAFRVQKTLDATIYAPDSILNTTKAQRLVTHDVLHFDTRLHHNIHDFQDRYSRLVRGDRCDLVQEEVASAVDFLDSPPDWVEVVNIASNHDEAFDKWLKSADIKLDPKNARFFHTIWAKWLEHKDETGEWVPAFELAYRMLSKKNRVRWVRRDEPYQVADIYLNFHGDHGQNGSKGSLDAYARLGCKTITGHSHQPGILDGAYAGGVTGDLDQSYNFLPSSWMNSHVLVYANAKRCIIHVIDGEWRAK